MSADFDITPMGEAALLFHLPEGADDAAQGRIWRISAVATDWPGVDEAIAGVQNLLVTFDPDQTDSTALAARLAAIWAAPPERQHDPVLHRIPVRYGGEDLDYVCARTGLTPDDYIARHEAGEYTVTSIGAQPGFGYLGGMDPALAVPRRDVPRLSVRAGAVIIGGAHTAITTITSPSGWHIIGETDACFFDPDASRPALFQLGDRVTFHREGL
ncbi:hypothetical protein A8A54_19050 [Brucella pseudogrignonensis]|uniref:5-oxoprolinase subunit PxpB n=1 Tax=Brucella pseudogrignonensis TaxID=419475 RepID=UPI0007DAA3E2|nr:5-oxoprolinase subunit PxpB [Brucella pseudogrignonensis]ANG98707.1 hypothetical protein A8A54_19050 [Brucella pseudogrignonensis]